MAGLWNNAPAWSITLVFLTYVYMCNGCTPTTPPSVEEKIYFSDIFIHGKVLDVYREGYDYDTLYTVQAEVFCIFKGPILDSVINITYAGLRHEPGLCISNNFVKGGEYLIYLDQNGKEMRPSFNEEPIDPQIMEDIAYYCEVETIEYPKGKDENNNKGHECPMAYPDYEDCIAYTTPPPTSAPEVTSEDVVVKTMSPKGEAQDEVDKPQSDNTVSTGEKTGSLEGSGVRILASLGLTALCLVASVF